MKIWARKTSPGDVWASLEKNKVLDKLKFWPGDDDRWKSRGSKLLHRVGTWMSAAAITATCSVERVPSELQLSTSTSVEPVETSGEHKG